MLVLLPMNWPLFYFLKMNSPKVSCGIVSNKGPFGSTLISPASGMTSIFTGSSSTMMTSSWGLAFGLASVNIKKLAKITNTSFIFNRILSLTDLKSTVQLIDRNLLFIWFVKCRSVCTFFSQILRLIII